MTRNARTRTLAVTIVLALLAFAGTTRAHEITRRTFTFLGERLTITLTVDAPGTLRVIRGEAGRLEVIARAEDGFVVAGLADRPRDELRLAAIGADRVEIIVVAPADTRIALRLPDRRREEIIGHLEPTAAYDWTDAPGR
jgi:hypothetical protein